MIGAEERAASLLSGVYLLPQQSAAVHAAVAAALREAAAEAYEDAADMLSDPSRRREYVIMGPTAIGAAAMDLRARASAARSRP